MACGFPWAPPPLSQSIENMLWIVAVLVLFIFLGPFDFRLRDRFGNRTGHRVQRQWAGRVPRRAEVKPALRRSECSGNSCSEHAEKKDPEAEAKRQEECARRAAAAEARFAKDKERAQLARKLLDKRKRQKGMSALEEAALENVLWRRVDEIKEAQHFN